MNKRIWLLLLVVYASVLLVTAPASVLSVLIRLASHERMELANTEGTLWNGSANPVFHRRDGELIVLDKVHWRLLLLKALTGKLNIELAWGDAMQPFPMEALISPGQVALHHVYIPLPAIVLDEASDFLKPAALRGSLILNSDSLLINRQGIQGAATLDWLNASSALSNISPLGNYHFTFTGTPGELNATLDTVSGALLLSGKGQFTSAAGLYFKGEAQASGGNEDALRELLTHLGPQERPGVYSVMLVPASPAQ